MTIVSRDGARLVGVASPVAGVAELHEMAMENNVMRMRAIPALDLPPGRAVQLKPGGHHLMLLDLRNTELTGKLAQETLEVANITVNRNTVPFETRSPFVTSGVRIGTPAVTTRGMKEAEMRAIATLIGRALQRVGDAKALASVRNDVIELCKKFPIDSMAA